MKILNLQIISSILVLFFSVYSFTMGATGRVYIKSSTSNVSLDQEFAVNVLLDTAEPINAFSFELDYPTTLQFVRSDTSGSIVELWQNSPRIVDTGHILLSGGLFQPFQGTNGLIVKIVFKTLREGDALIKFRKSDLYLADGKGTIVSTQSSPYTFSISQSVSSSSETEVEAGGLPLEEIISDTTPPEIIFDIVKSPVEKVTLLSFNATDKESGVRETSLRFKKLFKYSSWISVANPVLYPKGAWRVELKATNGAGLESTEIHISISRFLGKILFPILLLGIASSLVYNIRKRKL